MTDNCGWPTADGTACEHPPTDEKTGRCWMHKEDAVEVGRPSKFNDERARAAVKAAQQAKSKGGCARAAEVDRATLLRWLEKNPEYTASDGTKREFRTAFARARGEGETILVQGGLRRDDIDTSMAKFLLATSFDYVKTERREHDVPGEGGGSVEISINREVVGDDHERD